MRARLVLLGGGLSLIGAALAIQACGETDPVVASTVPDSGATVVDAGGHNEAASDTDASPCDTSANFTDGIPDAAIADGASTTGLCVQCANQKCANAVDECNKDCSCQGLAAEALDCYLKNSSNPFVCAGQFAGVDSNTQKIGIALLQCIGSSCKTQCATSLLLPSDAGTDASDAGDGGDGG